MVLHPQARTALDEIDPAEPKVWEPGFDIEASRRRAREQAAAQPRPEVAEVRDLDAAGRARWRAAVDAVRAHRRPWSAAMHEASWAAHVSGRTRAVAAAHLLAVQAFDDAGLDAADGAQGVWNALAGCVQGLALADLLEDAALEVLLEPWALVTGRSLLPG
jgi:hypothetical protein